MLTAAARARAAAQARVCLRCRASFAPVRKKVQKLLEGAKVTQSQRRVYDLREFRAGAKVTQNRRVVCDWEDNFYTENCAENKADTTEIRHLKIQTQLQILI